MEHLTTRIKIVEASGEIAGGITQILGSIVDISGFEGIVFTIHFGAIGNGAVDSVNLQRGDDPQGSDMADVAGSIQAVNDTDDNKTFVIDLYRPSKRYIRGIINRGSQANTTIRGAFYLLYDARANPVSPAAGINIKQLLG